MLPEDRRRPVLTVVPADSVYTNTRDHDPTITVDRSPVAYESPSPNTASMSDGPTQDEIKYRLEASEERVARIAEQIKAGNEASLAKVESILKAVEHSSGLAAAEARAFREEVMRISGESEKRTIEAVNQAKDEISRLRIWVLTGCVVFLVALCTLLARPMISNWWGSHRLHPDTSTQIASPAPAGSSAKH